MWPLTGHLVRFLEKRFRKAEKNESRPLYLDKNIATTPTLGLHALTMELGRVQELALRMGKDAISSEGISDKQLSQDQASLNALVDAIGEFAGLMRRRKLSLELADALPNALRVSRYYSEMAELTRLVAKAHHTIQPIEDKELATDVYSFKLLVVQLLDSADTRKKNFSVDRVSFRLNEIQKNYQRLKSKILRAGAEGIIPVRPMVDQLDLLSNVRRIAEQAGKGAGYFSGVKSLTEEEPKISQPAT
jgi:phosphate:Na+ symporter